MLSAFLGQIEARRRVPSAPAGPRPSRAGRACRLLALTAVISVLGFANVLAMTEFWRSQTLVCYGLLAGLILLPILAALIVRAKGLAAVATAFRQRPDSEHDQIMVRLVFVLVILLYLYSIALTADAPGPGFLVAMIAVGLGMCIGWGFFIHIMLYPGVSSVRRLLAMQADLWSLTFILIAGGERIAVWYPAYLWVTFGNGFRYGNRFLFVSALTSVAGF
ncbi:MAG: hypothetical protein ACREEE_09570, partial [Dongiaceae bacterium]